MTVYLVLQLGDYYSVEQLAIPFPADMQRVPVVVRVTNFNVSMDNRLLRFVISYTEDYALGQPSLVDVNIITNNSELGQSWYGQAHVM